ncbi:protealysin inhibitor emfourin [Streptacidiphilus neutrinimicus]|uniref:protealysin inhibitor emfourin n=1 Tax=Streptacidiphilus neutrinimicus TaxID=105420 RepID=UPI0005AACAB6|nr:protealysin inhibitor emfourin [Streptacidiphilus neutrinimicus]
MRIMVTRTGGSATTEHWALLDTEGRPDAPHIHALVREALGACGRNPSLGMPHAPNFAYAITVDGRPTGYCADPQLTSSQRSLIALVLNGSV